MRAAFRPEASCGDGCDVGTREMLAEGSGGSVIASYSLRSACGITPASE